MNNHTILAVNDAPDQLELLAFTLGEAGYQMLRAKSAVEGLKISRREMPDLIISDVMMPEMDGVEFCRQVRADRQLYAVPFLLISALRKDTASVVEGLAAGADDYLEVPYEPLRLTAKVTQLIERKRMEDALREGENRFRTIIENVRDIISVVASNGTIVYESPSLETILGYRPEELIGENGFDFIHTEDVERVFEHFKLVLESSETSSIEYRFRHQNGSWRTLESVGKPFEDSDNGLVIIINSRDVTEQKAVDTALRVSEERYRNFIEQSTEGIWRIEFKVPIATNYPIDEIIQLASRHGFYAECNDAMARMYGCESATDIIGKNCSDLMNLSESNYREFLQAFIENGFRLNDGESHEIGSDGESKYFLNNFVGMVEGDYLTSVWGIQRDVTDRKLAELVLQASQTRLEKQNAVFNELTKRHRLFHIPLETAIREVTKIAARVLETERVGVWIYENDKSKIKALDVYDLSRKQHSEGTELQRSDYPVYFAAMANDEAIVCDDVQTDARTSEFMESYLKPLSIKSMLDVPIRFGGQVVGVICHEHVGAVRAWELDEQNFAASMAGLIALLLESNERRQAENALRTSREYLEIAQKAAQIGSFEFNFETRRLTCSASMESLYEASPGSLNGDLENWIKYIYAEDLPAVKEELKQITTHDEYESEFRILTNAGNLRWIISKGKVSFDDNGNPLRLVGVNIDITERKEAETAVRFQKTLLEAQSEASIDGVLVVSPNREVLTYNQRFVEMWEISDEVLATRSGRAFLEPLLDKLVEPQKFEETVASFYQHPLFKEQTEMSLKDGRVYERYSAPLIDADANHFGRIWSFRDITERKKAEDSVRFQAHLLDTVEEAVIATSLDGVVVYWNQFAQSLYGWTSAEAIGRTIINLTAPAMNHEQANAIMAQLHTGKSWSGEFIARNKDGETFPICITNSPVSDAQGALIGIVGISTDISKRKSAEEALRQAEARFRNLVELSPAIVYLAEPYPPYSPIYVSPNVAIFGYQSEEWLARSDMWLSLIHEEDRKRVLDARENAMSHGLGTEIEYRIVARSGEIFWVHDKGLFISNDQGNKIGWQGVILDITENKKLQERLRQSQKLESVGTLAGGIAHDFNNMLTAINGYSDLTLRRLPPNDPLRDNIVEIKKAGERSAALTHQLLAFSRKQVLKPKILNLNEVIIETSKLLNRLIGEHIQLEIVPDSRLAMVEADPGQLTQVIMNLAVNARDAMPGGGSLIIETANVYLDEEYAENHFPTQPGFYVLVSVTDSGIGIDDDTRQHIFEPFFTTKDIGKGTGLGLATVYGIVKQSGGYIWVDSEIGKGTTFKIYLPRVEEIIEPAAEDKPLETARTGTETILLVEDEDLVRNMSRQMLEACGYRVIEANNGVEALQLCESRQEPIDLLMTDVVMPQMGGRELAEKLCETHPNIRLLYTSGYTDDVVIRQNTITEGKNFIQKPFTFDALAKKVRKLLD